MKKWIEINNFGCLFIEIELVTFDIPLLFVCMNEKSVRYLVLCTDEELGEYLIVRCTNKALLAMLNNDVPMDKIFIDAQEKELMFIKYNFKDKVFDFEYMSSKKLTRDVLPDEGAYFELGNSKIIEYIKKLNDEGLVVYNFKINTFSKNFMSANAFVYEDDIGTPKISEKEMVEAKSCSIILWHLANEETINDIRYLEDKDVFEINKPKVIRRRKEYAIV